MSDVDPLIRRELQWMALGVLENRDLSAMVIERVRNRRRKRVLLVALGLVSVIFLSSVTYLAIDAIKNGSQNSATGDSGAVGSLDGNAIDASKITGIISDYPLTWEQSVFGARLKPRRGERRKSQAKHHTVTSHSLLSHVTSLLSHHHLHTVTSLVYRHIHSLSAHQIPRNMAFLAFEG